MKTTRLSPSSFIKGGLFHLFFILFFLGCSNISVTPKGDAIVLDDGNITITTKTKTLKQQEWYYPPLKATMQLRRLQNGYFLIQEKLTCSSGYTFDYGIPRLTDKIFTPAKTEKIAAKGNVTLFHLFVKNKTINLVVSNQNKKTLFLYYPVPNKTFEKLYTLITSKAAPTFNSYETNTTHPKRYSNISAETVIIQTICKQYTKAGKF